MSKKSFFSPARAWRYLTRKPVTLEMKDIFEKPREAAERYRGFHTNDWEKCIGCGTCSQICPTDAIVMTEFSELPDEEGSKPERPVIDYGRCSFCGLCVDICTTGSLKMTREYIHIDPDPNSFFFVPREEGIHETEYPEGYKRDEVSDLLDLERVEMEILPAEKRKDSFLEIVKGFSHEQAQIEAARCVDCSICTKTCPAGMDIPDYIRDIYNHDLEEGLRDMYKTNPLPAVCGRMCTHKCETACTITNRGEAVSIRWLKRYIVDNVAPEEYGEILHPGIVKKAGKKVAVIGGGPAGLSAAYYLSLMGYAITVFEEKNRMGGVLNYGGPSYRLPDEAFEQDLNYIKRLGVEFRTNTKVGKDITLDQLHEDYDVVYASTGFTRGKIIPFPGADHERVISAMEILEQMKDYVRGGEKPFIPEKLVVIGGGNVALDVARSMVRLQNREHGLSDVHALALERTFDEMPADFEEKDEGREEGVILHPGWGPEEIVVKDGELKSVRFKKVLSIFDQEGRFNPEYDESQKIEVEADLVVQSIGQAPDYSYLPGDLQEKMAINRGQIAITEDGQVKGVPWLFAGGDIVNGPDIIHGIADGHNAARGIDKYIMGY